MQVTLNLKRLNRTFTLRPPMPSLAFQEFSRLTVVWILFPFVVYVVWEITQGSCWSPGSGRGSEGARLRGQLSALPRHRLGQLAMR